MDLKAEHFERQVQSLEQERDNWEKKYEVRQTNQQMTPLLHSVCLQEVLGKYQDSKKELDELVASMEGL